MVEPCCRRILAVALSGAVLVLSACGRDGESAAALQQARAESLALRLVSEREIRATPADSPQRTVLRFWRALQYRDGSTVRTLFSTRARRLVGPELSEIVFLDLGPSLQPAHPRIENVEIERDTALVYMRVVSDQVLAPKVVRQNTEYLGLALMRENGQWRIDDPTYFLVAGRRVRQARLEAERRAAQQR